MTRVFGHGGLRLVLLSLLEDGPKHGYELIVALEERFMGMYRPSSGTVYPRLSALEEEGLIVGEESGGRRIYKLSDTGREELAARRAELDETVISATSTVRSAMDDLQAQIRSTVAAVQADLGEAVAEARRHTGGGRQAVAETVQAAETATRQAWRASEHARRLAVDEAKRVRRAADDLRRQAEYEAKLAARQAREAAVAAARSAAAESARAGRRSTAVDAVVGPEPSGDAGADQAVLDDMRSEVGRQAADLGRHAGEVAAQARAELEDLLGDLTTWAGEAAEQLRAHLPNDEQRARIRAALGEARRVFLESMVEPSDHSAGSSGTR